MAEPLKNMVAEPLVRELAGRFKAADAAFDAPGFVADVCRQLPDLELKPRIEAIARRLRAGLEEDYCAALAAVVAVAGQDPPIEGFAAWPLCTFVEIFGLGHPEASLAAMETLTQRASCEFAIRPFLRDHWDMAYAKLEEFTGHAAPEVRRLPSEGTRPRLPWGVKVARLTSDPAPGLALLERLRHDPDDTVRRSVANHLNDVARSHPELVVATVARWSQEGDTDPKMVQHALRTLVKKGHAGALAALGYTAAPRVAVTAFAVTPSVVTMGDHITLSATVASSAPVNQKLVVDFVIHHITKSGAASAKVFKWKVVELEPGDTVELSKRRLIQMASTRTYYPGPHRVELQVAGSIVAESAFEVVM